MQAFNSTSLNPYFIADAVGIDYYKPGSTIGSHLRDTRIFVDDESNNVVTMNPTEIIGESNSHEDFVINKDEIAVRRPNSGTGTFLTFGASGVLKPNELFLGSGGSIILNSSASMNSSELVLASNTLTASTAITVSSSGEVRRSASGDADMLVKSYATVNPGATIESSSGNISVTNVTTGQFDITINNSTCLLYTSPSPRDRTRSRMPSSA